MGLIRLLKNDLARETRSWVSDKIITVTQARAICRCYGIDYDNQDKRSLGYIILTSLGYLFIGLAVITLMAANWEEIPRGMRMAGLICLTLATHALGLKKLRSGAVDAGIAFFFLGSIFYGAAIMLIAQIYHVGEHFPDGILFWALGVLPLGVVLKSLLLLLLAAGLGFIWFFTEASLGYFPAVFPVFLAAIAFHLWQNRPSRILFLILAAGTGLFLEYCLSWFTGSPLVFDFHVDLLAFGALFFIFCYGAAAWLCARPETDLSDYGLLMSVWCLRFFIVALFILSFEDTWMYLLEEDWDAPFLILGLGGIACGLCLWLSAGAGKQLAAPVLVCAGFLSAQLALLFGGEHIPAVALQVADNFFLVGSGIWLIVQGIRRAISHYFFLGVVTILAIGLVRYVDLVGDYMGAAALFTGFALILLGTARFWKRHHTGKEDTHA